MSIKKGFKNQGSIDGVAFSVSADDGGIQVPSLTQVQITAVESGTPETGVILYNSDTDEFQGSLSSGTFSSLGGGGGSGGGSKTYFSNGNFETLNGVTEYNDGNPYVDGSGGVANGITVDLTSSAGEVLQGTTSLRIAKTAVDATGEGVTLTTSNIDLADRGGVLFGSFDWDTVSTPFDSYVGGDIELHAYDVNNAVELPLTLIGYEDNTLPATKAKIKFKVFSNENTIGAIRISFHILTDSVPAQAWRVIIDEFKIGPQEQVTVMPYQDWVDAGPITLTGAGGNPTKGSIVRDNFYYRRVGDTLEGRIEYEQSSSGTNGSGTYLIALPNNLAIDTSKMTLTTDGEIRIGSGHFSENSNGLSAVTSDVTVIPYDANNITFAIPNVVSSNLRSDQGLWASGFFGIGATSANFSLHFRVPIAGWGSNAVLGANQRTFRASEIGWTQVSVAPTKFGELRALSKVVSSVTFTNDATAAPFSFDDGFRIYSVDGTSAGTAGEPNRYELFVGRDRVVQVVFYSSAGKTGHMLVDTTYETGFERGLKWNYDPSTGIVLITLPLTVSGTASRSVGYNVASGTSASNSATDCYFDVIVSDSPASLFAETERHEAGCYTGNGHGSTNTTIRNYSNTYQVGSALTPALDATNGASITVNEPGVYSIKVVDYATAANAEVGISLNASGADLTTAIGSVSRADGGSSGRLALTNSESNNASAVSFTRRFSQGDVIRCHTNAGPNNTADSTELYMVKTGP